MTEHVHRWKALHDVVLYGESFQCDCGLIAGSETIVRSLNATERLSKSKADTAASLIRGHTVKDDLKAYIRELEGTDES